MRFRVPLRLKSTSSLALATAASWLGVGRCLRLRAVSHVRRGDQVAGLRLRAGQAGLSADFPGIGDPAAVLNGGHQARIPFSRGLDGVAVAESDPRTSAETGHFRLPKKMRPVLPAAYAYSIGDRALRGACIVLRLPARVAVGHLSPPVGR